MKFGIQHPNYTYDGRGLQLEDTLQNLVKKSEELGYDSFWVMDHLHQIPNVGRPEEPMLEGWTTISVLSGWTSRIKLGTLVTANSYRHPSLLAKMGATLDVLSKGRLFMGIGAAWNDEEARAYGIPFPPTGERLGRLEEAVQIIKKMWLEDRASFEGEYYRLRDAYCNPKPIQKPHPKILIGGGGEKRTLRIAAKYADASNFFGSPKTVKRKLEILRGHCDEVGRDYSSIMKTKLTITLIDDDPEKIKKQVGRLENVMGREMVREEAIFGSPEEVERQVAEFRDVGIEYLISSFTPGSEPKCITLFAEKVMPKFLS